MSAEVKRPENQLIRVTIDEGVGPLIRIDPTQEIVSLRTVKLPTAATTIGLEVPKHPYGQHPSNEPWYAVYQTTTGLVGFSATEGRCYVFDRDEFPEFPEVFRLTANNSDTIEIELEVRPRYSAYGQYANYEEWAL